MFQDVIGRYGTRSFQINDRTEQAEVRSIIQDTVLLWQVVQGLEESTGENIQNVYAQKREIESRVSWRCNMFGEIANGTILSSRELILNAKTSEAPQWRTATYLPPNLSHLLKACECK